MKNSILSAAYNRRLWVAGGGMDVSGANGGGRSYGEPVCSEKFPANREFAGKITENHVLANVSAAKTLTKGAN